MSKKKISETELESKFQAKLIKKLEKDYGEDNVLKIPGSVRQGIADIEVTCGCKYARLEVKAYEEAEHQPNQDYYINKINEQGAFGRFIFPENEEEVLNDLKDYFSK